MLADQRCRACASWHPCSTASSDQPRSGGCGAGPARTTDATDHTARPLCPRAGVVQVLPPSARCRPASPGRRRPRRRAADPSAVPVLELRQWAHGFRGDGDGGDGPAAVIAARFLGAIVGPRGAGPKAICQALLQSHNSGLGCLARLRAAWRRRPGGGAQGAQPTPSPVRAIGERPSHAHRHRWKHAGERYTLSEDEYSRCGRAETKVRGTRRVRGLPLDQHDPPTDGSGTIPHFEVWHHARCVSVGR